MNEELQRIYQAISAVSEKVNDMGERLSRCFSPYIETKLAYIDDTEIVFEGVKEGNLSVFVKDKDGNYPDYKVERAGERVTVYFEPLKSITTVTISIL